MIVQLCHCVYLILALQSTRSYFEAQEQFQPAAAWYFSSFVGFFARPGEKPTKSKIRIVWVLRSTERKTHTHRIEHHPAGTLRATG
jgi:hypothetical protein